MREQESRRAEAEARRDVAARKGRTRCEDMLTRYLSAADYVERRRVEEETADGEADTAPQDRAPEPRRAQVRQRTGVVRA